MAPLFKFKRKPKTAGRIAEQRAYRRFQVGLNVDVTEDGQHPSQAVPAVIEDLSGGGMRLQLDREFEPGTRLTVAFALPGEVRRNDSRVEVLACERSPRGAFIARCRFVDLRLGGRMLDWLLRARK